MRLDLRHRSFKFDCKAIVMTVSGCDYHSHCDLALLSVAFGSDYELKQRENELDFRRYTVQTVG